MTRRQAIAAVALSLGLALLLMVILAGPEALLALLAPADTAASRPTHGATPAPTATAAWREPRQPSGAPAEQDTPLPTAQPEEPAGPRFEAAPPQGADLVDVVLLTAGAPGSPAARLFDALAAYQGLLSRTVDLQQEPLEAQHLLDEARQPLPLVAVDARTVLQEPPLLQEADLSLLRMAAQGGATVLVFGASPDGSSAALQALTGGAIAGVQSRADAVRDWSVSAELPEITRELTGHPFTPQDAAPQSDGALLLNPEGSAVPLVTSLDDAEEEYAIAAWCPDGEGAYLVDAADVGPAPEDESLWTMYYRANHFARTTTLLLALRAAAGDETWHNDANRANLTIDDPSLTEPYDLLSYPALLADMQAHGYHTTIAFVPKEWENSEPEVVDLFLGFPEQYSLAVHGNNHDGYEFYYYEEPPAGQEVDGRQHEPRPLEDQRSDLDEALRRMTWHAALTDIRHDPVMIFPWGISPQETLRLLKERNFLATVNGQLTPLGAPPPERWTYAMYPAELSYGGVAMLGRRSPGEMSPFRPNPQPFILDLFVDKPALFYSHAAPNELFQEGIGTFGPLADAMNALEGDLSWQSLGDILRQLYLEKVEDDGSVSVMFFCNELLLENATSEARAYRLQKEEPGDVPIAELTVNGLHYPFTVENGTLGLDAIIPPGETLHLRVEYGFAADAQPTERTPS